MIRLFLITGIIISSLFVFAWSITAQNNKLIQTEIKSAMGKCK
tara:strand:- start:275 stop:403 length:129 start_codon:yes stop_codon:yes gene_type:complete